MDQIYTVKEAAKILEFSTNTVYKYLEDGTLEAARGGGKQARFRIPHASLEKYLGTKLSEDHVLSKLDPSTYPLEQVHTPRVANSSHLPSNSFPLLVARLLLLFTLVLTILDLIFNDSLTLTTQLVRMSGIAIFVLLAYQFGGYQKV